MKKIIFSLILLLGLLSFSPVRAEKGHEHRNEARHAEPDKQDKQDKPDEGRFRIKKDAQITAGFRRTKVQMREIKSYIEATGRVELNADVTAHIIPRIPGKIYKVLGHLGDTVKKGQPLIVIDSLEMSKAKSSFLVCKSALALAESNFQRERRLYENKTQILEVIKKGFNVQQTVEALKDAELGKAKGNILTAMTDLELATDVYKREKGLLDSGIGAEKESVKAEKNLVNAKINLESVLEDIKINAYRTFVKFQTEYLTAKSQFGEAKERLYIYGLSDSQIAQVNSVSGIERALFPLVAPFDGAIVEKSVTLGEMVGEESLYTLSNLSRLWVITDIYEKDLATIKVGQKALVSVEAYKNQPFPGELVYISDLMDERTRTVKARVVVGNEQRLLKPGMFAQVKIRVGAVSRALRVPSAAVQYKEEQSMVFVVVGSEEFEKRVVKLGPRDKEFVAVLDGLKEGETIITDGSFLLKSELYKEEVKASHGHAH